MLRQLNYMRASMGEAACTPNLALRHIHYKSPVYLDTDGGGLLGLLTARRLQP